MTVTSTPLQRMAPTTTAPEPGLVAIQCTASCVDGLVLSTVVLHATVRLGLTAGAIGAALAAAGLVALLAATPLGALADRVGLRRAAVCFGVAGATAVLGYAAADSLLTFAGAALLFVVTQAASQSVRQALAVAGVGADRRIGVRAAMHTWLNVGMAAGTVLGTLVVWSGSQTVFTAAYFVAAVALLGAVGAVRRLSRGVVASPPPARTGVSPMLRDARFTVSTTLAALVQLSMPVLSVLLPVWVVRRTAAPGWAAGAALALNAVLVIVFQRRWAARLTTPAAVTGSAVLAAVAMLGSGALLAASAQVVTAVAAVAVVVAAVVLLTVGEVGGGSATWSVALSRVPADAEGRYQSAFSMSSSAARILGPAVALPLVIGAGATGWLALTAAMATACLGIALIAHLDPPARLDSPQRGDES